MNHSGMRGGEMGAHTPGLGGVLTDFIQSFGNEFSSRNLDQMCANTYFCGKNAVKLPQYQGLFP